MKTAGLLGGMSWESSLEYYRLINEEIKHKLGKLHSAKIILNSVDFEPIEKLQHLGKWNELGRMLAREAKKIEDAGADFLLICTNTMHKVADTVQDSISIPLLHIADATGEVLTRDGIKKVALLGTAFTMQEDFYKKRLQEKFSLEVIVPNKEQREIVHKIIYNELCLGIIKENSKKIYLDIIKDLANKEADGVILGCTEIGLLVSQNDCDIKVFDTTKIHAKKAVELMIDE